MQLKILENTKTSISLLENLENIWFDPDTETVNTMRSNSSRKLSEAEVKELHSMYKKVYYQYTQNACEECREHAFIQIEIMYNLFLTKLYEKYGG